MELMNCEIKLFRNPRSDVFSRKASCRKPLDRGPTSLPKPHSRRLGFSFYRCRTCRHDGLFDQVEESLPAHRLGEIVVHTLRMKTFPILAEPPGRRRNDRSVAFSALSCPDLGCRLISAETRQLTVHEGLRRTVGLPRLGRLLSRQGLRPRGIPHPAASPPLTFWLMRLSLARRILPDAWVRSGAGNGALPTVAAKSST